MPFAPTAKTCKYRLFVERVLYRSTLPRAVRAWPPGTRLDGFHPTDLAVITNLCFSSSGIDDWIQQRVAQDASFWEPLGLAPSGMYFGSTQGTYFIYPGRHSQRCSSYDPRIRPWYVAGSSGSKNVIMVLDQSGSMVEPRMTLLKEAAKRVIADNGSLFIASDENKRQLNQVIDSLIPTGYTDFHAAFNAAFQILEDSIEREAHIPCNTAILFLTDGVLEPDDPQVTSNLVMESVLDRINSTSAKLKHPIQLFTYSVSTDDDVHEFPRQLACAVDRVPCIDVALETLNNALGATDNTEAIKRLALLSSGACPTTESEECQLEFFRALTGGPESLCSKSFPLEDFDLQKCDMDEYPSAIIKNLVEAGKSPADRICCDNCGMPGAESSSAWEQVTVDLSMSCL